MNNSISSVPQRSIDTSEDNTSEDNIWTTKHFPAEIEPNNRLYVRQFEDKFRSQFRKNFNHDVSSRQAVENLRPNVSGFACWAVEAPPPDDATYHAIIRSLDSRTFRAPRIQGCAPYMTRSAVRRWIDPMIRQFPTCESPKNTLAFLRRLEEVRPHLLAASELAVLEAMGFTRVPTENQFTPENILDGLEMMLRYREPPVLMQAGLRGRLRNDEVYIRDEVANLEWAMGHPGERLAKALKRARRLQMLLQEDTPARLSDLLARLA